MFRIIIFLLSLFIPVLIYAGMHDPTCPPGKTPPHNGSIRGDLAIKSIIITPSKKTVIIGDRYLTIGDKIMGAKIIAIDQDTVTLQGKSGKFTIAMFYPIVKEPINRKGEVNK